jgi:SH3-like domain-containing protein
MILPWRRAILLVWALLAASPVLAQMSPPPGILTLPKKSATSAPSAPVTPPQPAPVQPVQQVAPFAAPQPAPPPAAPYVAAPNAPATPWPDHKLKKPTPVVHAPPNVHAQRAPGAAKTATVPTTPSTMPATPGGKPPATPAPAVAAAPSAAVVTPAAAGKPAETVGSVTKLPLPRWASLRADEVNLRVGPGMRFPIDWQYHRRELPVQILREVDVWRLIQDEDGVKGWVHQTTLTGKRGFIVKGVEAVVRQSASDDSTPVARLKPGVVGRIRACAAGFAWCEVQVGDYTGWLRREQFFGTDPGEAVGN